MSAWVIGGTSGIGAAIADRLRSMEINVFATGEDCDVTSHSALTSKIYEISDETDEDSRLEQVYFCAGVTELEWLGTMGPRGAANQIGIMEVNAGGFINLMDVLVDAWQENLLAVDGMPMKVCAISSDAAERPMRTSIGYCASKAALNAAIRVAARELGPRGWKVFGIAPGMIASDTVYGSKMTEYIDRRVPHIRKWNSQEASDYEKQQAVVKNPLRIHPGNVAQIAVDTALTSSAHMNGSIITINGGR